MAHYEEDLIDELETDEAEGMSEAYDELDSLDEGDELDSLDEGDEMDELDEAEDEWDEGDEAEGDEWDEYDEASDEEADEAGIDQALAFALAAEDSDEFFRRLRRIAGRVVRVARRVAPIAGRIARVAAPILRVIPHPAAQVAARVANVVGRLRMEGASEEEALEALSELAARNRAATPVAAAVAARALVGRAGAVMPPQARIRAVRQVRRAAQTLAAARPQAIRALPRVIRSVRRTAAVRRTPAGVRPQVALNTARRVAASPAMLRRLARPLGRGRVLIGRLVRTPFGMRCRCRRRRMARI